MSTIREYGIRMSMIREDCLSMLAVDTNGRIMLAVGKHGLKC